MSSAKADDMQPHLIEMVRETLAKHIGFHNYISSYLIGSLAGGGFVLGRSDCDVVLIRSSSNGESGGESKQVELEFEGIRISVSCAERTVQELINPFMYFKGEQLLNWKEVTVIEDLLMIQDHGIVLHGTCVKHLIHVPDYKTMRNYYLLRNSILCNDKCEKGIIHIAKSIVSHARECFLLWEGVYLYSPQVLVKNYREQLPGFTGVVILQGAIEYSQKTRSELIALGKMDYKNNNEITIKLEKRREVFFRLCTGYDREWIDRHGGDYRPIETLTVKSPVNTDKKKYHIPNILKGLFNDY